VREKQFSLSIWRHEAKHKLIVCVFWHSANGKPVPFGVIFLRFSNTCCCITVFQN